MMLAKTTDSSIVKKTKSRFLNILLCLPLLVAGRMDGAPIVLPEADLFYTSFESSESPSYPTGTANGLNGWTLAGNNQASAAEVITGGVGSYPLAPDGSQMIRLINAKDVGGTHRGSPYASVKFTNTPLTGQFYFSGLTAFTGAVSESTSVISSFYLANAVKAENFLGVIFGIKQHQGQLRFFYQYGSSEIAFGEANIEEGVFYRFELAVNVPARSYQISVYNYETNALLGAANNGVFRSNLAIDIDYLRLYNRSENGDNFTTFYDQLWIGSTPIPEPNYAGWMMGGGLILLLGRSRLRISRAFRADHR